jgi:hypothetical protein
MECNEFMERCHNLYERLDDEISKEDTPMVVIAVLEAHLSTVISCFDHRTDREDIIRKLIRSLPEAVERKKRTMDAT